MFNKQIFQITLIPLVLLMSVSVTLAQSNKLPVKIIDGAEDDLGIQLVSQIQKKVINSQSLRLSNASEPKIQVHVMTMSLAQDGNNHTTMYGIIWALTGPNIKQPFLMNYTMGYTDSPNIERTSKSIVNQTLETINNGSSI